MFSESIYENICVVDIVNTTQLFPSSVSEEDNGMLIEEVTLNELKELLEQFKLDKILGLDGISIEFFTCIFLCSAE